MKKAGRILGMLVALAAPGVADGGDVWTLIGRSGEFRVSTEEGDVRVERDGRELAEGEYWRREGSDLVFTDDEGTEIGRIRVRPRARWGREFRPPTKVRLGVGLAPIEAPLAAQLPEGTRGGVLLTTVLPDSPAARAGLQPNDVLVRVDGEDELDPDRLRAILARHDAGDRVAIQFVRAGRTGTVEAELEAAPPGGRGAPRVPTPGSRLGVGRDGRLYAWPGGRGSGGPLRVAPAPDEDAPRAYREALRSWRGALPGALGETPAADGDLEARLDEIERKLDRVEALLEQLLERE